MILPGIKGMLRPASAASSNVIYVGAGGRGLLIGTSVIPSISASTVAGNLLVAFLLRRSTAGSPPAGWSLASSAGPASVTTPFDQWVDVYTKTASSGDASSGVTFTQTSSGRLQAQIFTFSASTGTPVVESHAETDFDNTSAFSIAVPSISPSGNGRLGFAVGSSILANTSPAETFFTADSGWTLRGTNGGSDNRAGVFTKPVNIGDSTSCTITTSSATGNNGMTASALILAAP